MMIRCCKNCVPPKRYPGCGAKCPEYQAEHAKRQAYLNHKLRIQELNVYTMDEVAKSRRGSK